MSLYSSNPFMARPGGRRHRRVGSQAMGHFLGSAPATTYTIKPGQQALPADFVKNFAANIQSPGYREFFAAVSANPSCYYGKDGNPLTVAPTSQCAQMWQMQYSTDMPEEYHVAMLNEFKKINPSVAPSAMGIGTIVVGAAVLLFLVGSLGGAEEKKRKRKKRDRTGRR